MFVRVFESPGLAHFSYLLGDGSEAAVIDPQRDIDGYLTAAEEVGVRITHVFETHRNEDYVVGSTALATAAGADVYHGLTELHPFGYGHTAKDGDGFHFGNALLRALETPGHTLDSLSFVLMDAEISSTHALGVFTGDTLLIGGVGRSDFYPDRAGEVAGLLHASLFESLLPLGDQCLVYPAHGAGSICGTDLSRRRFSTIGYERMHNPSLQEDRDAFINTRLHEHHYRPPYFRRMEAYNQHGAPVLTHLPIPVPVDPPSMEAALGNGAQLVDTRSGEAFAGAHVPASLAMPADMLATWAGWLLDYDQDVYLIVDYLHELDDIVRFLYRLGFDRIKGYLRGGLRAWVASGREFSTLPVVHAEELPARGGSLQNVLLDVRSLTEYGEGHIPGSRHWFVGEITEKFHGWSDKTRITTYCESGRRAVIAAAASRRVGYQNVEVCLGSMQAYRTLGLEIGTE